MEQKRQNIRFRWDDKKIKRLVKLCQDLTIRQAADKMGVGYISARAALNNRGITVGKKVFWTEEKLKSFAAAYPTTLNRDLARIFEVTESAIDGQAFKLNLHKTPDFHEFHRSKHYFPKGHKPSNTGKTMPAHQREKLAKTMFKVGSIPHNTLHDGAVTIRHNKKTNTKYRYIRLEKGKWLEYYRYIWKQHRGNIPRGYLVRHINGDTLDDRLENLEMIPRKAQIIEHSSSINLKDGFVAQCIAGKRGKNKELINRIKQIPELIELKRNQLKLQRLCNQK